MKTFVLIAGLPGVGKSTLSRKIARERNGVVLDLDDFKKLVVDPELVTTQIDPPQIRWAYYEKAITHAFSLDAEVVVVDEVFHLHALRTKLEDLCRQNGVRVEWVEVRCAYPVVEKRLKGNGREGHILSTGEALKMYQLFSEIFEGFPEGKENHVVVDNNDE